MLRALVLVPLTVLALAAPAAAPSPSPSPLLCPHDAGPRPECPDNAPYPGGPSPAPTVTADPACPRPLVTYPGGGVTSGETATINVAFDTPQPEDTYTVDLVRQNPGPLAVVRSATMTATTGTTFTVRLGRAHNFGVGVSRSSELCFGNGVSFFIPVRAAVSLAATRNAPRDYSFTGRVQPAYGTVRLYRLDTDGRRFLSGRGVIEEDGTYRIDRRFTGSGRFGFVAVADPGSAGHYEIGSASRVRPTVLH